MQNVYNDLMVSLQFNKFIIDDLLFVEYTCPVEDDVWGVWSQTDFIFHVLKGRKTFATRSMRWEINEGETYYVKKGSFWMTQHLEEDFCMYGFFIPDDFIRSTLNELAGQTTLNSNLSYGDFSVKKINDTPTLAGFFSSMAPFFSQFERPTDILLKTKLKELLINLLVSGSNKELAAYLQSKIHEERPSIKSIMEANFYFNLSTAQYAELCQRSVSSFKREFNELYATSPGKWLQDKRLEFSCVLLGDVGLNIAQVAYRSGFENASHFSRKFKAYYGVTPSTFRDELKISTYRR